VPESNQQQDIRQQFVLHSSLPERFPAFHGFIRAAGMPPSTSGKDA